MMVRACSSECKMVKMVTWHTKSLNLHLNKVSVHRIYTFERLNYLGKRRPLRDSLKNVTKIQKFFRKCKSTHKKILESRVVNIQC